MSSVADQSLLLQAWIMITTNPAVLSGVAQLPLPWNATQVAQRSAAEQVVANIGSIKNPTENLLNMIGTSLLGTNPALTAPPMSNFDLLDAVRKFYKPYSGIDWPGEAPHPKGSDLPTFFIDHSAGASVGVDTDVESDITRA